VKTGCHMMIAVRALVAVSVALGWVSQAGEAQQLPRRLQTIEVRSRLRLDLLNGSRVWGRIAEWHGDTLLLHTGERRVRTATGSAVSQFTNTAILTDSLIAAWIYRGTNAKRGALVGLAIGTVVGAIVGNSQANKLFEGESAPAIATGVLVGAPTGTLLGLAIGAIWERWEPLRW